MFIVFSVLLFFLIPNCGVYVIDTAISKKGGIINRYWNRKGLWIQS